MVFDVYVSGGKKDDEAVKEMRGLIAEAGYLAIESIAIGEVADVFIHLANNADKQAYDELGIAVNANKIVYYP